MKMFLQIASAFLLIIGPSLSVRSEKSSQTSKEAPSIVLNHEKTNGINIDQTIPSQSDSLLQIQRKEDLYSAYKFTYQIKDQAEPLEVNQIRTAVKPKNLNGSDRIPEKYSGSDKQQAVKDHNSKVQGYGPHDTKAVQVPVIRRENVSDILDRFGPRIANYNIQMPNSTVYDEVIKGPVHLFYQKPKTRVKEQKWIPGQGLTVDREYELTNEPLGVYQTEPAVNVSEVPRDLNGRYQIPEKYSGNDTQQTVEDDINEIQDYDDNVQKYNVITGMMTRIREESIL